MEDFAVSAEYPGAIRQSFPRLNWPLQPLSAEQMLNVFEVEGGIVTKFYLSIDPEKRLLFINQLYDDIIQVYPLADLTNGETFSLRSNNIAPVPGRVVVIGGPFDLNYYHWIFNWFSRLILLQMLAPGIYDDPTVKFMIDARAQEEPYVSFLRGLNIDFDRVLWSDSQTNYRIEHMVLVSFLSQNSYYPDILKAVATRLMHGVAWQAPTRRRRIWISRQKLAAPKRRVVNMDEIAPILAGHGFEEVCLEDMSLAEQIELFAAAEAVAGVHGAGLANLIFCPADCQVLLIEKEFNAVVGLDRTFATLAQACGLRHEVMLTPSHRVEGVDYDRFFDLHHADVVIDPQALASSLDRIAAERRPAPD